MVLLSIHDEFSNWDEAETIILRYGVRYVYIGGLERSTYRVNEAKFQNHLKPVFRKNNSVIFEVSATKG